MSVRILRYSQNRSRKSGPIIQPTRACRPEHSPGEAALDALFKQVERVDTRGHANYCEALVRLAYSAALDRIKETIEERLPRMTGELVEGIQDYQSWARQGRDHRNQRQQVCRRRQGDSRRSI